MQVHAHRLDPSATPGHMLQIVGQQPCGPDRAVHPDAARVQLDNPLQFGQAGQRHSKRSAGVLARHQPADPLRDPEATKLNRLDYLEVLNRGIDVMDSTALTLCMDNGVPIVVFDLLKEGNMERVILGEEIGTLVGARA